VTTTNTITSTKATSEHTEASRTYQLSHTVEKSQRGPGAVKKVSVAIAVDQAAASADVVTQLTQMAQAAVGYDEKRGDTVSVVAIPMKIEVIATPVPQNTIIRQLSPYLDIARIAAMAIGPLLAVIVLALLLRRRRPYQSAVVARVGQPPLIEVATTPLVTPLADPGSSSMAPAVRRAFLRDQVTALAETHPALVASVLQVWVNEDAEARA
jgi:flagellar M-ring protein FliF